MRVRSSNERNSKAPLPSPLLIGEGTSIVKINADTKSNDAPSPYGMRSMASQGGEGERTF